MKSRSGCLMWAWLLSVWFLAVAPACLLAKDPDAADSRKFTHLRRVPAPKIIGCAEPYSSGAYPPENLVDGLGHTQYASQGKGTKTFVDFDLGKPFALASFKHVDRKDVATVDAAELIFSDTADFSHVIGRQPIDHVNKPSGTTVAVFSKPMVARYVRWQVTKLNAAGHACAGGAEIVFYMTDRTDPIPSGDRITARAVQALLRTEQGSVQPVVVTVDHQYAEPVDVLLKIEGVKPVPMHLEFGPKTVKVTLPATDEKQVVPVLVERQGRVLLKASLTRAPVRHWQFYFLPHSHVDIGYTHVQTEVEQRQWSHFRKAIEIVHETAGYPPEARFKWNSETLWAVDSYLKQAKKAEKQAFLDAVRNGWLHLDGLYGNELTALCRPEELMQLTACARRISKQYDIPIDAAMISDVPGYTWGMVPALTRSGIKYLSIGPNHTHRIGLTLEQWGDRPFWWVSPSGQHRLLCWMAGKAYSWFHPSLLGKLTPEARPEPFFEYLDELEAKEYPYDLVQLRYSIGGDNGPPDKGLSDFVKAWNEKYVWPRMAITTTSRLMRMMEQRYGAEIPEVRGDFTPYWEDGAASSARETAKTRMASERLVQAESLWALLDPAHYPVAKFQSAWRDAVLYDEHTWGAHCSISQPDSPFTKSQWKIKQAFALNVDHQSRDLLDGALQTRGADAKKKVVAVDVWNTTSWPRTDLVSMGPKVKVAGHLVKDADGQVIASQVTPSGKLMFVARDVPPFGARRYFIHPGQPNPIGRTKAEGRMLTNGPIRLELDPETGAVASLRWSHLPMDLVDRAKGKGLNQYRYVAGRDPSHPATNHATRIETYSGGLTSALIVFSDAPGCKVLVSIIRVIDGIDRVDIFNIMEKLPVLSKEAVHLAFPFQVPDGVVRMDIPWAVIRPEVDQLPGACKNYFTVGRWVDVSNKVGGVTLATLDAPLIEVGGIRVDVASPLGTAGWIRQLEPSQLLLSYVMNNYWETNYKASQEGKTLFRYALMPHRQYDQVATTRFAIERSQPLIVQPVRPDWPVPASRLRIEPGGVIVTSLKPSEDGRALMVRLWNAGRRPAQASLAWSDPQPGRVELSDLSERSGKVVDGPISLPPMGIVTLRAGMSKK